MKHSGSEQDSTGLGKSAPADIMRSTLGKRLPISVAHCAELLHIILLQVTGWTRFWSSQADFDHLLSPWVAIAATGVKKAMGRYNWGPITLVGLLYRSSIRSDVRL